MPKIAKPPVPPVVYLRTAAIGITGGAIATYLGVPLSWMLGALFASAAVALAGVKLSVPRQLKLASRIFVGLILGASINAETFARIGEWPASMAMMIIGMVAITALTALYYNRAAGLDWLTGAAASMPGGLSSITTVAIEKGAQAAPTVMGQLFRLTAIVVLVPMLYGFWLGKPTTLPVPSGEMFWLGQNLWIVPLALPAYWLGQRARLPSPELLAPMIATAALGIAGYPLILPIWLFAAIFVVLGAAIGARFRGITGRMLATSGGHSLVATFLTLGLVTLLAVPVAAVADVPVYVALLALAPGGIAEMAVLAIVLGVDPVFVTFHQALRSILLNSLAPFVLAWLERRASPPQE